VVAALTTVKETIEGSAGKNRNFFYQSLKNS